MKHKLESRLLGVISHDLEQLVNFTVSHSCKVGGNNNTNLIVVMITKKVNMFNALHKYLLYKEIKFKFPN